MLRTWMTLKLPAHQQMARYGADVGAMLGLCHFELVPKQMICFLSDKILSNSDLPMAAPTGLVYKEGAMGLAGTLLLRAVRILAASMAQRRG